jgi:hypothetical protein
MLAGANQAGGAVSRREGRSLAPPQADSEASWVAAPSWPAQQQCRMPARVQQQARAAAAQAEPPDRVRAHSPPHAEPKSSTARSQQERWLRLRVKYMVRE